MMIGLTTWLNLRGTLIALIKALDVMLFEQYGWTPRRHIDI